MASSSEQTRPNSPRRAVQHLPEPPQDADAPSARSTSSNLLRRQLWRARISIPKNEKEEKGKNELKQITDKISSIEFEPEKSTPKPIIVIETVPTIEPNETPSVTQTLAETPKGEAELKPPYEPVSSQTLQMLDGLSQHPDQAENPFELAEILFLSGNTKAAAKFYQQALSRKSNDDIRLAQDRAWILFQLGNCLREDDPPTAKEMYKQLITEHPDSPWTDLAKAQHELVDWYQTDKPRVLMRELILQQEPKTAAPTIGK